jgi:hypothetical protein
LETGTPSHHHVPQATHIDNSSHSDEPHNIRRNTHQHASAEQDPEPATVSDEHVLDLEQVAERDGTAE